MSTFYTDPWSFCEGVVRAIEALGYTAGLEGGGAAGPWVYTRHDSITCLWGPPPEGDLPTWYATAYDEAGDVDAVTRVAETAPIDDLADPVQVAAAIVTRWADINRAVDALAVERAAEHAAAVAAEEEQG